MVRILAAENNKGDARMLRMALELEEDWPVELAVTEDGDKALDYLRRRPPYQAAPSPDLVILDLNLPRRDGVEVLQSIRQNQELSNLLVMILSSSTQDAIEDRVRKGNVEADAYFSKPFDVDEFLAIGKAIRNRFCSALVKRASDKTLQVVPVMKDCLAE